MRRAGLAAAFLASLAASSACRSNGERPDVPSAPQNAPLSREVELAPGESAQVEGLSVKFEGVSADSRCPVGVQCFWEGDAVVVVTLNAPARAGAALELHTAGRFPREATFGHYRVKLVSLVPQPREGEPVPAGDYRATLLVAAE